MALVRLHVERVGAHVADVGVREAHELREEAARDAIGARRGRGARAAARGCVAGRGTGAVGGPPTRRTCPA